MFVLFPEGLCLWEAMRRLLSDSSAEALWLHQMLHRSSSSQTFGKCDHLWTPLSYLQPESHWEEKMNELNKYLFSHRAGGIDASFSDMPHTSLFPVADIHQAARWIKAQPFQARL